MLLTIEVIRHKIKHKIAKGFTLLQKGQNGSKLLKKVKTGFTLVELLVVLGILAVMLALVLIAINPLEILNKTQDVAVQQVTKDFASATKYFYATEKTTPWAKSTSCRDELATKDTVSQMPSCVQELTKGGDLQTKAVNSDEAKDIFMTECSGSVALCYKPKSSTYRNDSNAKYGRNGALNPECPGGDNCYTCEFTTNEAQECFEIMSPNAEIASATFSDPEEPMPIVERPSISVCNDPQDGAASCMSDLVTDSKGTPLTTLATPNGLSPEQMHKAYNLPCTPGANTIGWQCDTPTIFGPKTVAVILAFHSPTIESDLAVYSQTFGLPPCTKANGCLTIVNQNGQTSPLPSGRDSTWAVEAAMDVQIAHAICQTCKILLVEAEDNYFTNLGAATSRAAQMGATAISNSYGNYEYPSYAQYESFYDHPGIAVTASSGDWGYGTIFPASHSKVIGVGGTELSLFPDNSYASEKTWNGAGSGCSATRLAGTYQTSLPNWSAVGCGTKKSVSDVSAVASPYTGAAVYDSGNGFGRSGWKIIGGTSLSSPLYAAVIALQGGIPSGTDGSAFPYTQQDKFRDVNIGSNGSCGGMLKCMAGVGYDGPTGLGTPNLIPSSEVIPTVLPTNTPTPTITPTPSPTSLPTPTSTPTPTLTQFNNGPYIVNVTNNTFTKVTSYTLTGQTPIVNCVLGTTTTCSQIPTIYGADAVGQCNVGNTGYAVFSKVACAGLITTPTATPTATPTPTPTTAQNCGSQPTVTLEQPLILALAGDTVSNNLIIKSNDPANCTTPYDIYTISTGNPNYWTLSSMTVSFKLAGGSTRSIPFTLTSPATGVTAGEYQYQFWVQKSGLSSPILATGKVKITQDSPPNPTYTPTPIPPQNCNTQQTIKLTQSQPILALAGDTVNNILTIKNNNTSGCSSLLYTISSSRPTGWTFNGVPASVTVASGVTKEIYFSITTPSSATAGNYGYQFWVARPGESSPLSVSGSVQIAQVGPPPTPTPTPINCFQGWSNSLGSTSLSGNAGDTLNQTLTITYNNPPSCGGSATFGISHSYPSGWIINNLPPSVQLAPGQSITIPFTIKISTGALVQDYLTQYWVNSGGQPMNATIHVLATATPPEEQMFSNFNAKSYGSYALFEYSYNATGNVSGRLDVSTDPNGLNTTTTPPPAGTRYGFAFNSGSAMDSSNQSIPTTVHGFINSSPQSWAGWQCGATIYYRMYNSGDLRIKSPVKSTIVDCTTQIDVLPWNPWYAAIYQGVYDSRYDADNNGTINYIDYWILVRATRLR